ncbi:MAG: amidohydrolase family protein, partial [Firmicutes bacterium]|nr:amidohydrolase family protein [Bacillota bacterium]
ENERGTLGVGKYCDMVVLDKNLYEIDPDEIKDANVIMTVIDGEIVYEA